MGKETKKVVVYLIFVAEIMAIIIGSISIADIRSKGTVIISGAGLHLEKIQQNKERDQKEVYMTNNGDKIKIFVKEQNSVKFYCILILILFIVLGIPLSIEQMIEISTEDERNRTSNKQNSTN